MSKEKKLSIICHSVAGFIVIALMTILCFKTADGEYIDLAINKSLSNASSPYGLLFMCVGEYPQYFIIPISAVIMFFNADTFQNKNLRITFRIITGIVVFGGWGFFVNRVTKINQYDADVLMAFTVYYSIIFGGFTFWVASLIKKETMHKLFKLAVYALVFALTAYVVISLMKIFWCRMRYRDLLKEGSYDGFTPWYKLMFGRENANPDYDYTSFPSGHTSSCAAIFVICLLPNYIEKLDKKWIRHSLYVFCVCLTIALAISRIVNNAHYLSDVIAGGTITYAIFYFYKWLLFRNGKYEFGQKELTDVGKV